MGACVARVTTHILPLRTPVIAWTFFHGHYRGEVVGTPIGSILYVLLTHGCKRRMARSLRRAHM